LIKSLNKSNEKFRQHAKARDRLIEEFHRIMKPKSIIYLDSHRLTEDNIISTVTGQNLFKICKKPKRTLAFERI
jgi:protoporphyrinogen oxidase